MEYDINALKCDANVNSSFHLSLKYPVKLITPFDLFPSIFQHIIFVLTYRLRVLFWRIGVHVIKSEGSKKYEEQWVHFIMNNKHLNKKRSLDVEIWTHSQDNVFLKHLQSCKTWYYIMESIWKGNFVTFSLFWNAF